MSSLAKQILENRNRRVDDAGIPTEDSRDHDVTMTPQYLVARTLARERQDPGYDSTSVHRLHMRKGVIYRSNEEIAESDYMFYALTGVLYKVEKRLQVLYWIELKRYLPHLNPNIYKISENLWWDKISGEIIEGNNDYIRKRSIEEDYEEF